MQIKQITERLCTLAAALLRGPDPLRYALPEQGKPWGAQPERQRASRAAQPLQSGVRVVPGTATLVKDQVVTAESGERIVETVVVTNAKGREKGLTASDKAIVAAQGLLIERAVRAKPLFAQGLSTRDASRALTGSFGRGYSERSLDQYWAAFAKAESEAAIGETKAAHPYTVEW
jgi:hypothetical protein